MISPYLGHTFITIARSLTMRELLNTSEVSKSWNNQANLQEIWDFHLDLINIEKGQGDSKEIYLNHILKLPNRLKLSKLFKKQVTELDCHQADILRLKATKNKLVIRKSPLHSHDSDVATLEGKSCQPLPGYPDIEVTSCTLVQDSQIISGTNTGKIVIWNLESREQVDNIQGHSSTITLLKKFGENVISGSDTGKVKLWDFASRKCIVAFDSKTNSQVTALLGDENTLIAGLANGQIKIWDFLNPSLKATLEAHDDSITKLLSYQDILISGSADSTIKMWDLETDELIHTFKGHAQEITCLKQKGHLLFSGSSDTTIKVWDLKTNTLNQTLKMHESSIIKIKIQLDCLIVGSANKLTVSVKNEEGLYANPEKHQGLTYHPKEMKDFVITEGGKLISCTARNIIKWG